ncbi:MAG: hypothetical protein ACXVRH_03490 [Thermoleophilaceae bacterium]
MSLLSRIGRAIERRMEASPGAVYVSGARDIAWSPASDEEARDELARRVDLRERLEDDRTAISDAVEELGRKRESFIDDRAYRLLSAAMTGSAVRPIDPAMADLFRREEQLGRMPLKEAFEQLAALQPRLRDAKETSELVGYGAGDADPLLRSDLAASVVSLYGKAMRGFPVDVERPYFEANFTSGVITGGFGLPQRPRARN